MKVLIACEFSGVVREAFNKLPGVRAWSCDLLPCEDNSPFHIMNDVLEVIEIGDWDLMIAHPPCTYICNSSAKHLYKGMKKANGINRCRWWQMREGAWFYKKLKDAPINKICIENPIMLGHARNLIGGTYTQIIQPHKFGHMESKATCLELKNLPKLKGTDDVEEEMLKLPKKEQQRIHYLPPSADRGKLRSITFQGFADAMAQQWGEL